MFFHITDYKFEGNFIMFKTNTDEWIKLTKNNPVKCTCETNFFLLKFLKYIVIKFIE